MAKPVKSPNTRKVVEQSKSTMKSLPGTGTTGAYPSKRN